MSFLMDELKKAERSQRAAGVPPASASSAAAPPLSARRQAPARQSSTARTVGVALSLLLGGGAAAYYWMPAPAPAVTPVAPGGSGASGAPPSAQRGYAALMAGDVSQARSEYLRVLEAEPASLDALHGLAAVSLRQGQADAAEAYYLRALKADPRDALAQAGLVGLKGQADPHDAEERLKALLAAQPELAFLNYALGNLYAGQNRWNEAQQAFLVAYRAEPDNPDILFNLAVTLDHLRQPAQALSFYRLALAAAEKRPASFDRRQANARLLALEK